MFDVARRLCYADDMMDEEQEPEKPDEEFSPPLYRDKRTARFADGERVKEFQAFEIQAKKRLLILQSAVSRNGLMLLPSNRFEALSGDRKGQYSIRINRKTTRLPHPSRRNPGG